MRTINDPCPVEGCNGTFGPGCMVRFPHPLYHKCKGNFDLASRVWEIVNPTGTLLPPPKEKP